MNEIIEIPVHLTAPNRRARRRRFPFEVWASRLFVLPHMLIGAIFLFAAMPGSAIWAIFGQDHAAHVSRIWSDNDCKARVQYHVSFSYSLPAGERSQQKDISAGFYNRLLRQAQADRTVVVRAIKVGPIFHDELIEDTFGPWKLVALLWLFGCFWCLITGALFNVLYIHPRRERQLCRSGKAILGKVLSKHVSRGKSTAYYLRYAFITPNGQHILGDQSIALKEWQSVEPGQPTIVLYDPAKPHRSVMYEYAAYKCISQ